MSESEKWNEQSRTDLRETLRSNIVGELRLGKHGREEILTHCREAYIDDECPEEERETFVQFAEKELDRASAEFAAEQAGWPKETDCDRLDRVEAALRDRGILLWQVSPCCDTCTVGEMSERVDEINGRFPGFRERLRGYAFFIDQSMPDMLSDGAEISVYLGYGWYSPDGKEVAPEIYEQHALGIAREVCECLRAEGFEPDWDGAFSRKIGVRLNWQRRTPLE